MTDFSNKNDPITEQRSTYKITGFNRIKELNSTLAEPAEKHIGKRFKVTAD